MVQDPIKIHIGGKMETTQEDVKQAENLVQKDLLQRNKDKGDKARSAQDERMIAQGLADYIIKEVRSRQEKRAEENKTKATQDMVEISATRLAYMERTIQRNEELRYRNRKLIFKGNDEMPKKPGLYWAKAKETGRWPFTDAERIIIAMVSGVPPMLFVEYVFPYGRLSVVDAVTVQTKDRTDPARIEWGPEIEMPEGFSPDATGIPYTDSAMATLGSKVKVPID